MLGSACLAAVGLTSLVGAGQALGIDAIIYVDADAAVGGDGQSWATAYRYLQDALDEANSNLESRYEIWVAEGVYYPDEDGDGDHLADAVTETFRISRNSVQLYGGFTGDETVREERDWKQNATVLSGDLDANDKTNKRGVVDTTTNASGKNAYHVLWLDGAAQEAITEKTVIDGFSITAGRADGAWPDSNGGGLYCAGGGVDAMCNPTLINVTFSGNSAAGNGGAMLNSGLDGDSSPTLTNVTFSGNSADGDGGAMYNSGWYGSSSPKLTKVVFSGNSASGSGGAMFSSGGYGISSPTLIDVIFNNNSAGGSGGAMVTDISDVGSFGSPMLINVAFSGNSAEGNGGALSSYCFKAYNTPTLVNVTFTGNSAGGGGGAVYNDSYAGTHSFELTNVILWDNGASEDGDQMYNLFTNVTIGHSVVEGGWDGSGVYNYYGSVTSNGGNIDADPQFVDASGGNLCLRATSPAVDAGDNDAVPPGTKTDLVGNPRFVDIPTVVDTGNGTPPIVDMGAYEVQYEPYLVMSKSVTPRASLAPQGTVTYAVVLDNMGLLPDNQVLMTDTLPTDTSFVEWIEQPAGAALEDDVITWIGKVDAGMTVPFVYSIRYARGDQGEVLINTAEFSGTVQTGRVEARFLAASSCIYLPVCLRSQ